MTGKLRNRLSIAASYFRHQTVLSGGPIEITLESTAKCNLYCPMCPRHIYTFDNENMNLELYKKVIQDCKDYVEFIWPYGIGEPMIHPNIFEMIRITRDAGIRTGMSTNATLMDDRRADMLLDSVDPSGLQLGSSGVTTSVHLYGRGWETGRQSATVTASSVL